MHLHQSSALSSVDMRQVVLDLGRRPEARFLGGHGGEYLRDREVCFLPGFYGPASHQQASLDAVLALRSRGRTWRQRSWL